jgi:hypothetical protein
MKLYLTICSILLAQVVSAQLTLSGKVVDSLSNDPLPFVKVLFVNSTDGAITDFNGGFKITTHKKVDSIQFSYVGFKTLTIAVPQENKLKLTIPLVSSTQLKAVEVVAEKKNPAFRILKEINDHRPQNDPRELDAYECEVYNKLQFDLNNIGENFEDNKLIRKFDFIADYTDTINGTDYLPVLLSESVSNYYYKNSPQQKKEVITATHVTGIDNLQLGQFTGDMYQNVNIYDNFIGMFGKDFLSPIAQTGRAFYKYYLMGEDTLGGQLCYHLMFRPRREGDGAFIGDMWITDSTYAVKRVIAEIPDHVNINYISSFKVEQNFDFIDSTVWMVTNEKVFAEFKLFNEFKTQKLLGVYVRKTTSRNKIIINDPHEFDFYTSDVELSDSASNRSNEYWNIARHDSLSNQEAGVISMVDSLKDNKRFKLYDNLSYMAYTGFLKAGPIEIGNIFSAYNQNVVEGHRVMLSLRTSNKFSKKHEINAFGLYGFGDEVFKYGGSDRFKLNSAPREMFRIAYKKKIEQLGLSSRLGDIGNSFTTLFSAGPLDKLTMVNQASFSFEKDYRFNMRTFNAIEWKNFTPLGSSDYSRIDENGNTIKILNLTSFEIRNQIMYTKEEKFVSGSFDRYSLGSRYPIISLTHTLGIKEVFGSEYNFNRLDFILDHRPKIGFWGKLHYNVYAGKIFGTLPYPFLNIHEGNQTYYLQTSTFNLLNYYEFVSDTWIGVNFEHRLQGLILDKVPLIKKLKWRTIYTFKAVIGSFDDKHLSVMNLPTYTNQLSYTKPYMEASVGVENIFKFIRIDAIWRLSYLNTSEDRKPGVKFTFTGDF